MERNILFIKCICNFLWKESGNSIILWEFKYKPTLWASVLSLSSMWSQGIDKLAPFNHVWFDLSAFLWLLLIYVSAHYLPLVASYKIRWSIGPAFLPEAHSPGPGHRAEWSDNYVFILSYDKHLIFKCLYNLSWQDFHITWVFTLVREKKTYLIFVKLMMKIKLCSYNMIRML